MHQHSHGSHHCHDGINQGLRWAFFLNLAFTCVEFAGGVVFNSTAILADAVHDLGDCLAIGLAILFQKVALKAPSTSYTYGYKRFTLMAAVINGTILVVGSLWVIVLAIERFGNPQMPDSTGMVGLAVVGILVNGFAAYKVGGHASMSSKMVNWHLIEDVLGWVAILIAGVFLMFFQWPLIDPILSIGFACFILFNVYKLLKQTVEVIFQAVPKDLEVDKIINNIKILSGVEGLHDVRVWSLDGEHHVFTAHVALDGELEPSAQVQLKQSIADCLSGYNFLYSTIEFEFPMETCRDQVL